MENGGADITTIGLFSFISTRTPLYSTLAYRSSYRFFFQFQTIHIVPLSSGFSHFSLHNTSLPPPLALDATTGTIHGELWYPTSFNVTVSAENMADHTQALASFFVEVAQCGGDRMILQIERTSQLYSSIEMVNITTSAETIVSHGYDSLAGESSQVSYYCIPKEVVKVVTYISPDALLTQRELRRSLPGSLIIRIPYPDYDPDSHTVSFFWAFH